MIEISKSVRKNVRNYNTNEISSVIEETKGMKSFRKTLSEDRKNITKLEDTNGHVVTKKVEILNIVKTFYAEMVYGDSGGTQINVYLPKIQNQGSDELPEITSAELLEYLNEMKNNKTFNACLMSGTTPSQWDRITI